MESIKRNNKVRAAIWCVILALCGTAIAVTVNGDSYLARYYDVRWYMVTELVVTALTLFFVWLWWHLATSESVRVQGVRMWISEHGALSPLISFLPVWLVASVAHVICSTAFTLGSSGYRIYSVFILPFFYMALAYLLPPVEICETILPFGGKWAQRITRGFLIVAMLAVIGGILFYDFG